MCITMAASIASQFPNMDKNEVEYAKFIKEKIEKAGGLIKFQHITGHLSQLAENVRLSVGSSPTDLRKFLKKHNELFTVDAEGFVSFQKSAVVPTEKKNQNYRADNDSNRNESDSLFPVSIVDVPGIVIKVLPTYGFIAIKNPIKTSVYFTPSVVIDDKFPIQDEKGRLLTDIPDMLPGKKVRLHAKKANTSFEAKYRASKVWTPPNIKNEVLVPNGFKPKDALYDPISIEGSGKIQKVFEHFGFITNDSSSENIFFHKTRVCNVQNIMNLSKVFSAGDLVEFKAIRSSKKDIKVRWEASKVWMKKQGKTNLFKMEDSSGISLSECDSQSQKSARHQKNATNGKNPLSKTRVLLDSEPGKIFPHTDGVVIKFGKNDTELADADSCPFYLHGAKVQDVCWEFSDGDNVCFDGIKIKSAPGWKALLAWVGEKPNIVLPTHVGDFTEFSDDDTVPMNETFIPDLKSRIVRPSGSFGQSKRDQRSRTPNNQSRIFKPTSASSQVSNSSSRSVSKSRSSVDNDFDILSEDTKSSISVDSKSQAPVHHRRRLRRRKKGSSHSSLTDDTAMDSEDSYTNQDTVEFHNSGIRREDVGTNILSQATLKPSLSSESLDLKSCLKPNPEIYKNWGDSPYPEDENSEENPATEEKISLKADTNRQFEEFNQGSSLRNEETENASNHLKSPDVEIFHSDDEFSDAVQENENFGSEVKSQKPVEDFKSENKKNLLQELSDSDSAPTVELKTNPYIKCFCDLEGKVLKVFCKYAEIENSLLIKSISVLWSDLYHNGVPVADKFDDMKEVIKTGQIIKFSCIEIVDDKGSCWQKVTVAWKGQKPNVKEITPQEYISQNYLHVTVDENEIDYGTKKTPSQDMELAITSEASAPPRKFLSVAFCDDDDEDELNVPSVEVEDSCADLNDEESLKEEKQVESILPVEEECLAEAVSRMISDFASSQVDINTVSADIISLVLSRTGALKAVKIPAASIDSSEAIVNSEGNQSSPTDSLPMKPKSEMRNSETQTINTGEVIAQSLFTNSMAFLQ